MFCDYGARFDRHPGDGKKKEDRKRDRHFPPIFIPFLGSSPCPYCGFQSHLLAYLKSPISLTVWSD